MPRNYICFTHEQYLAAWWSRVVKEDGCWRWTGVTDRDGYGVYYFGSIDERRAHRISFILHGGSIPDGMFVCHRCDNPPCCNPEHLFIGSVRENTRDMIGKGRNHYAIGSATSMAKLTDDQVLAIRSRYVPKKHHTPNNQMALAREFGVNQSEISRIVRGKMWAHV